MLKSLLVALFLCTLRFYSLYGDSLPTKKLYNNWEDLIADSLLAEHIEIGFEIRGSFPKRIASCKRLKSIRFYYVESLEDCFNALKGLDSLMKIDLSDNQITSIPSSIKDLTGLESLILYDNLITELPDSFVLLRQLRHLDLSSNKITGIGKEIEITQLQYLNLENNKITELKVDFKKLSSLRVLELGKNNLTEIPNVFHSRSCLTKLDLSRNRLVSSLSLNQLLSLPKIKELKLNWNKIDKIKGLLKNNSIEELDLSGNQIIELSFKEMSQLKTLELDNNPLGDISEVVENCKQLKVLSINKCGINSIVGIGVFHKLEELNLSSNLLVHGIKELLKLKDLRKLFMMECGLVKFPFYFDPLLNLEYLELSQNKLVEIPVYSTTLNKVTYLGLYKNQVSQLPIEIGNYAQLIELELGSNNLTDINKTVEKLTSLQTLNLGRNKINKVSANLAYLTYLKELDLGSNKLKSIPSSISKVSSLEEIDISYNSITQFPQEFAKLKYLKELNISGLIGMELKFTDSWCCIEELNISNMELSKYPTSISVLLNLKRISARGNNFTEDEKLRLEKYDN